MKHLVATLTLSTLVFSCHQKNKTMEYKNGFKVIGIAVETTNEEGKSAEDIGRLWHKFYEEEIPQKIPSREGEEVYSIYTDYESDYQRKYTAIIGMKVSSLDSVPSGLVGREFEGGNYLKFVAMGKMPDAVAKTWQQIWNEDEELNRKYTADFEIYDAKSQNGEGSEVAILIATEGNAQ